MAKVVLAYSGGLDTSVVLKWLLEKGHEVYAFIANVGQPEDFEAARKKAILVGAKEVFVEDCRKEFVTDYIFPALRASARYEGRYLLGTSLARPIIAKKQIEIAKKVGATAVAHGATGKGNDQVRFELCYLSVMPEVEIIAPWKNQEFLAQFEGREDLLAYAAKHNIPIEGGKKPFSMDANLMHISYESGVLEDPNEAPPSDMFKLTVDPSAAPDESAKIEITFEKGTPVLAKDLVTGKSYKDPLELFIFLNETAGKHGVGRIDIVENRFVGIKSRGVYETPAGTVLWAAHDDLETISMDKEVYRIKSSLINRYAEAVYNGFWFSPEMEYLNACVDASQGRVTGTVTVELFKGNCFIKARTSTSGLYSSTLASMDVSGGYNQQDAAGFIRINSVRLRAAVVSGKSL